MTVVCDNHCLVAHIGRLAWLTRPALSILAKAKPTLEGRVVGCLVADGTDSAIVTALRAEARPTVALR
jgi:hypothetical protein